MRVFIIPGTILALGLALSACTDMAGNPNRAGTGVLVGGATGAIVGNAIGDERGAIVGGALGAMAGAAIGNDLDRQAAELNQSLAGSGATVNNTGNDLRVVLPDNITFATGSSTVYSSFMPSLRSVSESLRKYPHSTVQVVGHTDNVGTAAFNQQLSEDRARAVANVLISNGTPANRIAWLGRGLNQPIASNATEAGRAQNRRVEIIITPTN